MENHVSSPIIQGEGQRLSSPQLLSAHKSASSGCKNNQKSCPKQLVKFMKESNQNNPNNHAYKSNHNTTTAMTQLSDLIFEATDRNLISTVMTVYQTAAFDCMKHSIFNKKMKLYNFDSKTREWFSNYLKLRTQYVVIGGKNSRMKPITTRVPQGSVLGPMIYTIYVNEEDCKNQVHQNTKNLFPSNCLSCGSITSYADDSTFFISNKSREIIQRKI